MSIPFVDLKSQYNSIQSEIDLAIQTCLNDSSFIGGQSIGVFENAFKAFTQSNYCVACANGTDALEIALKALGIGPGDEVIVPALTWISTAGSVANVGAEPIFVDVIEDERTINPAIVEEKITPRTKAIIPVHLYGLPARMNQIMELAKHHNLKVIEDCAQAHGAEINGAKVGSFGHLATYSFYPGKNLGAYGDAGAITTNHESLAETCKMITNHGQLVKHSHQIIGRNSRMDTLQAAILNVKIKYLDQWTSARIKVASWYDKILDGLNKPIVPGEMKHVFHLYVIQSDQRESFMKRLKEANIGHAIHYPTPLPHLECFAYQNYTMGDFPVAEKLCSQILSLPIYPELKEQEVDRIAEVLS